MEIGKRVVQNYITANLESICESILKSGDPVWLLDDIQKGLDERGFKTLKIRFTAWWTRYSTEERGFYLNIWGDKQDFLDLYEAIFNSGEIPDELLYGHNDGSDLYHEAYRLDRMDEFLESVEKSGSDWAEGDFPIPAGLARALFDFVIAHPSVKVNQICFSHNIEPKSTPNFIDKEFIMQEEIRATD